MKAIAFALLFLLVPSVAYARGCTETSDVVGLQHCTSYGGKWALESQIPVLSLFGFRYSEIGVSNLGFGEDTAKQTRPDGYKAYHYEGSALGVKSLHVVGLEGGIQFFLWKQLYTGIGGVFSWGEARTASFRTDSGVQLSGDSGINVFAIRGAIPVGYRIALGRASLRPEMDVGFESITISHDVTAPGLPDTGTASAIRGVVEPRLDADFWLTPHVSFGVYGAYNLADGDGHSRAVGFAFTWHNRSFDGDTSF